MLVDIFHDEDLVALREIAKSKPAVLPRLEKIASIEKEDPDSLANSAFAWPEQKKFPIYTPEHALASSVYLEGADDVPNFVKEACEEACALFGYDIKIGEIEKRAEQKEELRPDDFLLPLMRKLPAVDKETTIVSAGILEKNASLLKPDDIIVASRQLINKASEFDVPIDDKFRTLALDGHIKTAKLSSFATDRMFETGDSEYVKIASSLHGDIIADKRKITDIVFYMIDLDNRNNLEKTAEETILSIVEPGSIDSYIEVGGIDIPTDKIASVDAQDWQELFGRSLTEALFESGDIDMDMFKEVTASMSPDEQEALFEFLEQYT